MKLAALLLALPLMSNAQNYKAEQTSDHGIAVVRLTDAAHGVEVSIVPSVGNEAYEMKVHGKNILHFPYADVSEFQKRPALSGIPFLAPWGNRLDQQAFIANGKKYPFDMTLGNVRGANPIHGLLSEFTVLARHRSRRGPALGARNQPARVLEISRTHEAMAVCA